MGEPDIRRMSETLNRIEKLLDGDDRLGLKGLRQSVEELNNLISVLEARIGRQDQILSNFQDIPMRVKDLERERDDLKAQLKGAKITIGLLISGLGLLGVTTLSQLVAG